MDDIYKAGGRVLLATPFGARPAWLSAKYPEVLRWSNTYVQNHHGNRHNHCYTSPVYREKITIINEKLAERYKDHPRPYRLAHQQRVQRQVLVPQLPAGVP